jgi:hypothetical protein
MTGYQLGPGMTSEEGNVVEFYGLDGGGVRLRVGGIDRDMTKPEAARFADALQRVIDGGEGCILELTGWPPIELRNTGVGRFSLQIHP